TCCRFSPRKWISSLAWRNAAIPFRLNFSASCTLIIHPQHACILQAHLVLETDPSFRLILYWKRLHIDSSPATANNVRGATCDEGPRDSFRNPLFGPELPVIAERAGVSEYVYACGSTGPLSRPGLSLRHTLRQPVFRFCVRSSVRCAVAAGPAAGRARRPNSDIATGRSFAGVRRSINLCFAVARQDHRGCEGRSSQRARPGAPLRSARGARSLQDHACRPLVLLLRNPARSGSAHGFSHQSRWLRGAGGAGGQQ